MITNWYDYTIEQIASIFENLGYDVAMNNNKTKCTVCDGCSKTFYYARVSDGMIELMECI